MTTDFRALCTRMADELDDFNHPFPHPLAAEARAAMAQSEPEGPTNEELKQWYSDCADETIIGIAEHHWAFEVPLDYAIDLSRAVLARWGRPTPQSADGEVAELVDWLRGGMDSALKCADARSVTNICKAINLLSRLSPPQPIPVRERLPGPGDCIPNPRNGQGQWCWGWCLEDAAVPFSGKWRMMRLPWLADDATHWLPAHVLPSPISQHHFD
jgi:hypothetical protein